MVALRDGSIEGSTIDGNRGHLMAILRDGSIEDSMTGGSSRRSTVEMAG
jgi:hypothetical protein